ncbi:hypothetical protein EG68_11565 [Paragonimus skrjabini miyazakii]|uniref:Uncharacterized protein n=1 Tax=Paragonimus skrjabini miyazakii TaxID=59628 RepID=A0A8S9YJL0_9TREM|nr:hypothetical protein EG68_11565 [Paragonimus skrjabini miyazakii]
MNKQSLSEGTCQCDICLCFEIVSVNTATGARCKIGDRVKVWGKCEGMVGFMGSIRFRKNVNVFLIGVTMFTPISSRLLAGYSLYCPTMYRVLVLPTFLSVMAPGERGVPKLYGFESGENADTIRRNRLALRKRYRSVHILYAFRTLNMNRSDHIRRDVQSFLE